MDRLHEELKEPVNISDDEEHESEDDEDDEHGMKKQKKLLGGNASSDDSPADGNSTIPIAHPRRHSSLSNSDKSGVLEQKHRKRAPSTSAKKSVNQRVSYRSIITTIFDGKLLSSVQCLTCNRVSNTLETYQDLSIPIPTKEDMGNMHIQQVFSCSTGSYNDTGWITYAWDWLKSWFIGPDIQLQVMVTPLLLLSSEDNFMMNCLPVCLSMFMIRSSTGSCGLGGLMLDGKRCSP